MILASEGPPIKDVAKIFQISFALLSIGTKIKMYIIHANSLTTMFSLRLADLIVINGWCKSLSTNTIYLINLPKVTSPTSTGEAPGPMYATLGTRGTTATSPPGLIGTLPEEDETAEEHAAAAAPVPPMFADPPRKHNMTGKVRHSIFVILVERLHAMNPSCV